VNVTFVIDRKRKVKIGKINFHGNEQFKDKRLRRTFKKTHQKSINFFKSSKLKEDDYETDKENLIDFYNSKGYRNFTILSDSIYPINDRRLGIDLSVSEGNKYYIRNSHGSATRSTRPATCNACSASNRATPTTRRRSTSGWATARRTTPKTCRSSRFTRTTAT